MIALAWARSCPVADSTSARSADLSRILQDANGTRCHFRSRHQSQVAEIKPAPDQDVSWDVGETAQVPLESLHEAVEHDCDGILLVRIGRRLMKGDGVVELDDLHEEVVTMISEPNHAAEVGRSGNRSMTGHGCDHDLGADAGLSPFLRIRVDRQRSGQTADDDSRRGRAGSQGSERGGMACQLLGSLVADLDGNGRLADRSRAVESQPVHPVDHIVANQDVELSIVASEHVVVIGVIHPVSPPPSGWREAEPAEAQSVLVHPQPFDLVAPRGEHESPVRR